MFIDLRWIIFAAANLLLCFVCLLANEALGPHGMSVYLYGACVVLPALRLRPLAGWAAIATPALVFEANTPGPYGLALTVWSAAWFIVRLCQRNIRTDNLPQMMVAVQLANLVCFTATATALAHASGAYWLRACTDLFLSQAVLFLITPWFFALQNKLLQLVRLDGRIHEDTPNA